LQARSAIAYVAKLNAQGQTQWAHLIGSTDNQNSGQGLAINIDNKGNIYVGGNFGGKIDFDFGVDTFNMSTVFGADDVFVLKLSSDADYLWARRIGGDNQSDKIGGIAVQNENNYYVAGTFLGTTKLDPMGGSPPVMGNSVSFEDIFVVKYEMASIPTSIAAMKAHLDVRVYPTPVQDFLYIELEEPSPIKIYSLTGQLLKENFGDKKTNIDVSDLPAGVYVLQVQTMALRIVKL
jgi:hypothetical protein